MFLSTAEELNSFINWYVYTYIYNVCYLGVVQKSVYVLTCVLHV